MPSQWHEPFCGYIDVGICLSNMVRPRRRPGDDMGLIYLDGIENFDNTGMAQCPEFLQRVSSKW